MTMAIDIVSKYRVVWEIEVVAANPQEAAKLATDAAAGPSAKYLAVTDLGSGETTVVEAKAK